MLRQGSEMGSPGPFFSDSNNKCAKLTLPAPATRALQGGVRRLRAEHSGGRVQSVECADLRRARMWQRGPYVLYPGEPHRGVHLPEMRGEGSEEIIDEAPVPRRADC